MRAKERAKNMKHRAEYRAGLRAVMICSGIAFMGLIVGFAIAQTYPIIGYMIVVLSAIGYVWVVKYSSELGEKIAERHSQE